MLKLGPSAEQAAVARRIKAWAVARFGAGEEAWLVTETPCRILGRPSRQTVVALVHPAARIAFRLPCGMHEITRADIEALGDGGARLAAEGCC